MRYKGIDLVENEGKWYFESAALAATHDGKSNDAKRKAWMEKAGVADSQAFICCLGKVLHGRAHRCPDFFYETENDALCSVSQYKGHEWFDHSRMFWIPGRREYVLTAQPYDVSLDKYKAMERFAAGHGLTVEISLEDAWWYPGRTPLIVWHKASE